jgi:hypothetical protein
VYVHNPRSVRHGRRELRDRAAARLAVPEVRNRFDSESNLAMLVIDGWA